MRQKAGLTFVVSILLFLLPVSWLFSASAAQELEMAELTPKIAQKKMSELFQSHCLYHNLELELVKRQSKDMIERLDPIKLYFLESEIQDWIDPSQERLEKLEQQWASGNFSEIEALAKLTQSAINRRQRLEKELQVRENMKYQLG
jgi:carboxyl-terminal processing protease